jgi:hypothetical protein
VGETGAVRRPERAARLAAARHDHADLVPRQGRAEGRRLAERPLHDDRSAEACTSRVRAPLAQISRQRTRTMLWGQVRPGSGRRPFAIQRAWAGRWVNLGGWRTGVGGTFRVAVNLGPGIRVRLRSSRAPWPSPVMVVRRGGYTGLLLAPVAQGIEHQLAELGVARSNRAGRIACSSQNHQRLTGRNRPGGSRVAAVVYEIRGCGPQSPRHRARDLGLRYQIAKSRAGMADHRVARARRGALRLLARQPRRRRAGRGAGTARAPAHEGRSYRGFHHHTALVTCAHAFLSEERLRPRAPRSV